MDEALEFLNIIKDGKTEQQERAAEIYESLIQDPPSFFRKLYEVCISSENTTIVNIGLIFMEKITREYGASFSEEQKQEDRQNLMPLLQKLDTDSYNVFSTYAQRVLVGADKEWKEFYEKTNGIDPKKHEILITSMLNHVEKSFMFQPAIADTGFSFTWAKEIMEIPGIEPKIPLMKFLSIYVSTFPDQISEVLPHFPLIIEIAKKSRQYDMPNYQLFWFHVGRLFAKLPVELNYYNELLEIALENMADEKLSISYKLPLVEMLYTSSGEIPLEVALRAVDCCNYFIISYKGAIELPPMSIFHYYCALFEKYSITDILEFMHAKVDENFHIEGENAVLANIYLTRAMFRYCPSFFLTNWEIIDNLTDQVLEKPTNCLIVGMCYVIMEIPWFFAMNPISLNDYVPKIIQFLSFGVNDSVFNTLSAIDHVFDVIKTRTEGITEPLIQAAEHIPDHLIGMYLVIVSKSMNIEFVFSTEEIAQIVGFAAPLLADDDMDAVNGAICVCIEAMNLNDRIKPEIAESVFAAVARLFDEDDLSVQVQGIERLAELIIGFPEEATELSKEKSDVILSMLELDEDWEMPFKQRAIIGITKITCAGNIGIDQQIVDIASEWLDSDKDTAIIAAALTFETIYKNAAPENAQIIFDRVRTVIMENENKETVTRLLLILASFIAQTKGDILPKVQQAGRELFVEYVNGQLAILEGVPPETNDIDYKLLRALTKVIVKSVNGKNEEVPTILHFYDVVMEKSQYPFEVFIQQSLFVWQHLISADALDKEAIDHMIEVAFAHFTPTSSPIWYRDVVKIVVLFAAKKYIPREAIIEHKDVINEWFQYCIEHEGQMVSFINDLILLIFFSYDCLDFKEEFEDLFIKAIIALKPTPTLDMLPILPTNYKVLSTVSENEEFNALVVQVYCSYISLTKTMCRRLLITDEAMQAMRDKLKEFVTKSPAAAEIVKEYISESEGRDEIFSYLYQ